MMNYPSSLRPLIAVLVVLLGTAGPTVARAADWPAYRHDIGRSGSTQEQIGRPGQILDRQLEKERLTGLALLHLLRDGGIIAFY